MVTEYQFISFTRPEGQYYFISPVIWQFFIDPDMIHDMHQPSYETFSTNLEEFGSDGKIPRARLFFKPLTAAPTLAAVTFDIMLSGSLFDTVIVVVESYESLAAGVDGQLSSH